MLYKEPQQETKTGSSTSPQEESLYLCQLSQLLQDEYCYSHCAMYQMIGCFQEQTYQAFHLNMANG